jgi:hypothetical protein
MPGGETRGGGSGGSRFLYEPFGPPANDEEARYRNVLRSLGTPDQILAKFKAIDELIEEKKRRDWVISSVRTVAAWAAAVATGWLAFKGLLTDFLTGLAQ